MIDISKIFKETSNIKDNQLQFLLESGVDPELAFFLEGGELPSHANGYEVQNPPIDQNLEGAPQQAILPQDNIINYQGKEWVVYGDRMVPREVVDKGQASVYTSGNYTNEQFSSPYQQNLREEQALAQSSNTINSITSTPQSTDAPSNNGSDYSSYGDFSTAFAMARQNLGPKNVFTFNGKTYNTNLAGEGVSPNKGAEQVRTGAQTKSTPVSTSSNESTNSKNTTQAKPVTKSATSLNADKDKLAKSKTSKAPIFDTNKGWVYQNGRAYTLENYRNNIDARVKKYNEQNGFMYYTTGPGAVSGSKIDRDQEAYREAMNTMKTTLLNRTFVDEKTNEIVVNGNRFSNNREGKEKAKKYLSSKTGLKFDTGSDNSLEFGRKLIKKEFGGDIPMFNVGGEQDDILRPLNKDSVNLGINLPTIDTSNENKLVYYSGKQNIDGRGTNIAPGYYKQSDVNRWESQTFSKASNLLQEKETEGQLRHQENLMKMFNVATGDTSFGVEDALYKVGESLAYKPLDDDFRNPETGEVNKVGQDVASGFNILRGVSAAGKALLGGTRNVLEGYSTEKRNKLLMEDYYRKQANAMINGNTTYSEEGGEIPFFNDGGYLKFLEEGDQMQYSEMGPQENRPQMPLTEEMTGEFIQQQPSEANITPNAEVENREFIQHPDGQVQQVKGRTHNQGGERVELEGGTKVVSDKLKLGAKNAKLLREQFGLNNIKASDTYAVAVEKYTKKIGLKELNEQQQEYFDKLKKEEKTKDENTSELNNEVLSEKINNIEQKKSTLEEVRAKFTDYTYQLQEGSKKGTPREGNRQSNNTTEFSLGGSVPMFSDGGIIEMANIMESNLTDEQLKSLKNIAKTGDLTLEQVYNIIRENSKLKDNLPTDFKTFSSSNKLRNRIDFNRVKKDLVSINKDADAFNFYTADTTPEQPKVTTITPGATAKSVEDLQALNNMRGSNSLDATVGGENWKSPYDSINNYRKSKGMDPVNFSTHKDYQSYLTNNFSPQIINLYRNNEIALTNAHRQILKENGVKNADKIVYWKELDPTTQLYLGDEFITQGYTDGLAGHRGLSIQKGTMTEEEYDKLDTSNRPYDKLTDSFGNKIYFEYNADGSVKKGPNGELIAYYPSGEKVPEKEVVNATENIGNAPAMKPKTYNRPILPDMSLEPPRPMEAHLKAEHRYATIDPTKISYDDALTELNRQSDAALSQMDGLTDTQRAAAISNLTANTQSNAAKIISQTNTQNAQIQANADQTNVQIANREVDANVADAQAYEAIQMKAKALTEADVDNFHDKNREIRIKRNEFLRRDRQINDMIENYHTDASGNIIFDNNGNPISKVQVGVGTGGFQNGDERTIQGKKQRYVVKSDGTAFWEDITTTNSIKK